MRPTLYSAAAATIALLLSCAAAEAAQKWPTSLVGYVGVGQSNETSLTVKVYTQSSTGTCRTIAGVMFDWNSTRIDAIDGFYCPSSGRVSFTRRAPGQQAAFQTYLGNVSETAENVAMAGTFAENANLGALGEYPFGVQSLN